MTVGILLICFSCTQQNVVLIIWRTSHCSAMQIKACYKETLDKAATIVIFKNIQIHGTGKIDSYQVLLRTDHCTS